MKKLKSSSVKILKMFHILLAFSWLVGCLALCFGLFLTFPESGDELYMRSRMLQITDDCLIIPGGTGAIITGLIYCIWTNWGFFKHTWIIVKLFMTVLQSLLGAFLLGPCINDNVLLAGQLRDAALSNPAFLENLNTTKIWGTVQAGVLLLYIFISVQKPWKKK
jgi:uncharacterized membrane protein